MKDLSILIPALNEPYLQQTVDDILRHTETDFEIIVGLDGWLPKREGLLKGYERIKSIYEKKSIGQRAMIHKLARQATGKYVVKCDAHCSFAQGFDKALLDKMEDDLTMTPMLATLDVKDWRIISKPITTNYLFDSELRFQYDNEVKTGDLIETMALQGSFYMMTKKRFLDLNICDEKLGSWGFQGVETALKSWLSGGRVVTNTDTFYGHYFRNKLTGEQRYTDEEAKKVQDKMKKIWLKDKWPKQTRDLKWLVEKFNFPCDWSEDMFK